MYITTHVGISGQQKSRKTRNDSIKTGQYTTFLHTYFVMQLWKKMSVGGTNHVKIQKHL